MLSSGVYIHNIILTVVRKKRYTMNLSKYCPHNIFRISFGLLHYNTMTKEAEYLILKQDNLL